MILSFIDADGKQLDKQNIYFEYNNISESKTTDDGGIIEFAGVEEDCEVNCYLTKDKKQHFTFKDNTELVIALEYPVLDMRFVVAKQNGDAAADLTVHFEYNGNVIEKQTDSTGQISLSNISLKTKVKAFQFFNDKEENIEHFQCEKDKAQYFYVAEEIFEKANMNFKLVDKSGQAIKNSDIRFKNEGSEFENVTNNEGRISIEDVKIGAVVECKQLMFGKSLPWHKFTFDKDVDEYIIHGEKLTLFGQENENYDSQVRMKIKLVNSKSEPIANAIINLNYDGKTRNKYTNLKGEVQIDDVLIGSKVEVFVDVRGNKTKDEFTCEADNETQQIMLKTGNDKLVFWLIPLVVIVGLAVLFSNVDLKSFSTKAESVPEKIVKDTVIINDYQILVKEKTSNKIVRNAKVELKFKDSTITKFSDTTGQINFKADTKKLPIEFKISLLGYNDRIIKFKEALFTTVFVSKNDSFDIADSYLNCGLLTESPGSNITYRTFYMNMNEGRFKLFYNMFGLPDQIDVYNGAVYEISDKKLIYSSEKMVSGLKSFYINFNSPDSLVTIRVKGEDNTTKWLYKVFCPRRTLIVN